MPTKVQQIVVKKPVLDDDGDLVLWVVSDYKLASLTENVVITDTDLAPEDLGMDIKVG